MNISETIKRRQAAIDECLAELQCLEACYQQGFTLADYIEVKKMDIQILEGLNEQDKKISTG